MHVGQLLLVSAFAALGGGEPRNLPVVRPPWLPVSTDARSLCEPSEPRCLCSQKQRATCLEQIKVDFGRSIRICLRQACGATSRSKRQAADIKSSGAWKSHHGYTSGVRDLRARTKATEACAQAAIDTAVDECGYQLSVGNVADTFWESVAPHKQCAGKLRSCVRSRDGRELSDAFADCERLYSPQRCDREITRLQCACIQGAKSIIDLKCPGFFLGKVRC